MHRGPGVDVPGTELLGAGGGTGARGGDAPGPELLGAGGCSGARGGDAPGIRLLGAGGGTGAPGEGGMHQGSSCWEQGDALGSWRGMHRDRAAEVRVMLRGPVPAHGDDVPGPGGVRGYGGVLTSFPERSRAFFTFP